jgi:hypothetical protein
MAVQDAEESPGIRIDITGDAKMSAQAMTRRFLFGAAVLAPTLALAQPPGGPDDGPRPPGPPIMAALDTNHDGALSPEEIRNAAAALQALDHNHDGKLDRAELDPRGDGPGVPEGPPEGGRRGGPPADGPDGPPGGGRPPGAGRGRPQIGHVLPPFVREQLALTDRQVKQIAELENNVKGKLESILSARQLRQMHELLARGPGGAPPDDQEDGPPVRPQRPR